MGYRSAQYIILYGQHISFDPIDSTPYFIGATPQAPSTSGGNRRIYIPHAGRITRCVYLQEHTVAASSNENIVAVLRINDTTDYAFATVGSVDAHKLFANYSLSIPVAKGDYVELKITTPAWVTNPQGIFGALYITIETYD